MKKNRARVASWMMALLWSALLAACSTRADYRIDRSHTSVGKDERIEYIILHYTAENQANSLKVLTEGQVSSHYLIGVDEDARIYQLVADDQRAWHAGRSHFRGKSALNDISIGIEIVNDGIDSSHAAYRGYRPYVHYVDYTPRQIDKVAFLVKHLAKRYQIAPENILGHSDIAPSRKVDPGAKFPWEFLYTQHGIGAWYDAQDKAEFLQALQAGEFERLSIAEIKQEFRRYGYEMNDSDEWDKASKNVIYAFQLHFRPTLPTGELDMETLAILRALNKKYRADK